jgi:hypothetical protein
VETLFRNKTLKVVVSTATLALGVNMPCKTSVFALDSRFLTPLQYRQMSGRAGRRGFDNVGHVVFYGVPHRKAFRLMKSPLTSLQGHFPLTTTTVLRMLNFYEQCFKNRKQEAVETFKPMLKKPFCFTTEGVRALPGQPVPEERYLDPEIQHYFRFAFEFLQRQNLIDSDGKPIGMAGLVAQTFGLEPANFAFAKLLECGVIGKICSRFKESQNREKVSQEIMLILCHLFNRVPLAADVAEVAYKSRTEPTSSIFLEALPSSVSKVLDKQNKDTLELYTRFAKVFSVTCLDKAGNVARDKEHHCLPISRASFGTRPLPAGSPVPAPAASGAAAKVDGKKGVTPAKPAASTPASKGPSKAKSKAKAPESWEEGESWEEQAAIDEKKEEPVDSWEDEPETQPASNAHSSSNSSKSAGGAAAVPAHGPAAVSGHSGLFKSVTSQSKSYRAISPFAALSGIDEKFSSVLDLTDSIRWGLWLDQSIIPVTHGELEDIHGQPLKINAYAFDFYKHGRYTLMMKDNGLRNTEAWALLKQWSLFLQELKTTLSQMVTPKKTKEEKERDREQQVAEEDEIVRTFNYLSEKFDKHFNSIGHVRGGEDLEL